jgi:hypothetical protein
MKIIKRNYNKDFRKGMVHFHSDATSLADYDLYGYSLLNDNESRIRAKGR